jgi:transcriptional regulator with PAS, ATPase and Fis domain
VRRRIAALVAAPGHVLVLGETGTGKERVARAIAESRKPHPLVIQNRGELSRELARSELFGHVQGAFSGASHSKPGLIDAAVVGELSLDVQVDLFRKSQRERALIVVIDQIANGSREIVTAAAATLCQLYDAGITDAHLHVLCQRARLLLEKPEMRIEDTKHISIIGRSMRNEKHFCVRYSSLPLLLRVWTHWV